MGKRWRRINERFRQQIVAPHFQPASTERNQLMFREAVSYCHNMKLVMRKLNRLLKDYEDLNGSVQALLECRAPRTYNIESDGSVGAELHGGDELLGSEIQTGRLTTCSHFMQERIAEEVLSIYQKWLKSFERCRVGLHELKSLKFELDSRQRTVISLQYKKNSVGERVEKGESEKNVELKETTAKLSHKEQKYHLCLSEFRHKEEELNQSLRSLLSEVSVLTELIGRVYQILSDAPQDVYLAFLHEAQSRVQSSPLVPSQPAVVKSVEDVKEQPSIVESTDKSNPFLTPP